MSVRLGGRVVCSECGRSYAPTQSGKVRTHWARRPDGTALLFGDRYPCSGSGKDPVKETQS
jgi:hypothetical protein